MHSGTGTNNEEHSRIIILLCIFIIFSPFLFALISLFIGRYNLDPGLVLKILASSLFPIDHTWSQAQANVIFNIRIPRIIGAILVGGGLSVAGAVYQALFRNPLVSPDILGVSSGSGFGAAIALLISAPFFLIEGFAFISGIIAVCITLGLARIYRGNSILILVLSGIIISAFYSSLISLIKYVADPSSKLPAITYWLMGSLSSVTMREILLVAPIILCCVSYCILISWKMNTISLGEEEAASLGLDTKRLKIFIILASTLITASAVCISGIIGWIGLVIPHLGRLLVGPDNSRLIPISFFLGAAYLLIIDTVSRTVTNAEIPLGIITAIVGVPVFAFILSRRDDAGWM